MNTKAILIGLCLSVSVCVSVAPALAANPAEPLVDPVQEMPTMHSLGVYWIIKGDDNRNATITLQYKKPTEQSWHNAPNLFRVEKGHHKRKGGVASLDVPDDAWLFAGSALLLQPGTDYELKLTLTDPDGGSIEKTLRQSTTTEPVAPKDIKDIHVIPGNGGGTGTQTDPYKGIPAAIEAASPGTRLLLHKGTYDGPIVITKSGEPGKPIILQGADDAVGGEAIIDGKSPLPDQKGNALDLNRTHDVWVENLTIINASFGINLNGAQRSVIRRNNIHDVHVGIWGGANKPEVMTGFFISDNTIKGPLPFPLPPELWHKEFTVGIEVGGLGHEVCYNTVTNMEDSVDVCELVSPNAALDFHHNEGYDLGDDGSELDGGERNIRFFDNRYTNSLCGISFQPTYGGPCYVFRNAFYNFRTEATKLHTAGGTVPQTGGAILVHNTFVHAGPAWFNNSAAPIVNCISRNNLFLGTDTSADKIMGNVDGNTIFFGAKTELCDFDYDGFSGFKGARFMKWNNVNYATAEEAKEKSGIEKHLIMLDPATLFASGISVPTRKPSPEADKDKTGYGTLELNRYDPKTIDLRLKKDSPAIGQGLLLPEYGDNPNSQPYLGAYPPNSDLPHYGPRK